MLEPTRKVLLGGRVILASKSPRRQELIKNLGIKLEICPSTYNEDLDRTKYRTHGEYVQDLAYYKALEVYDRFKEDQTPPLLVIGADTLVTLGDTIYGKPKDESDAFQILSCLANKQHCVFTGVCLKTPNTTVVFHESTNVKFRDLSEAQIREYVKTGEPLDKAGAYGIQGIGACLIEKVDGDRFNVMGLPLNLLIEHLNKLYAST